MLMAGPQSNRAPCLMPAIKKNMLYPLNLIAEIDGTGIEIIKCQIPLQLLMLSNTDEDHSITSPDQISFNSIAPLSTTQSWKGNFWTLIGLRNLNPASNGQVRKLSNQLRAEPSKSLTEDEFSHSMRLFDPGVDSLFITLSERFRTAPFPFQKTDSSSRFSHCNSPKDLYQGVCDVYAVWQNDVLSLG